VKSANPYRGSPPRLGALSLGGDLLGTTYFHAEDPDIDPLGLAVFDRHDQAVLRARRWEDSAEGEYYRTRSLALRVDATPRVVLEVRGPVLEAARTVLGLALVADGPDADDREELVLLDRVLADSVYPRPTVLARAGSTRSGRHDLDDLPTLALSGAPGRLLNVAGADVDGDGGRELLTVTQARSGRVVVSAGRP